MNYFLYMAIVLMMPAFMSNYICHFTVFFDKPDASKPADRTSLVWIVFGFCVWLAHSNYGNNRVKWEACDEIERLTGEVYLDVCLEREPSLYEEMR